MERCPVCRAKYREGSVCQRCQCDLAPLLAIEDQAGVACRKALSSWTAGNLETALSLAEKAHFLQNTTFTNTLLTFLRSKKQEANLNTCPKFI